MMPMDLPYFCLSAVSLLPSSICQQSPESLAIFERHPHPKHQKEAHIERVEITHHHLKFPQPLFPNKYYCEILPIIRRMQVESIKVENSTFNFYVISNDSHQED